LAQE